MTYLAEKTMVIREATVRSIQGTRLLAFTEVVIDDAFHDRGHVALDQSGVSSKEVRLLIGGKPRVVPMNGILIPHTAVEAYGVRGKKCTAWRKTFASYELLVAWVEQNSAEIHGCIDCEVWS